MDATEQAAIVAAVVAALSQPAEPVAAEPVAEYVSPLQRFGIAAASGTPSDLPAELLAAWNDAPKGHQQRSVRETARILKLKGFSCTVDVDVRDITSGATSTIAAHGFWRPVKSGEPCKGVGCPGKVR